MAMELLCLIAGEESLLKTGIPKGNYVTVAGVQYRESRQVRYRGFGLHFAPVGAKRVSLERSLQTRVLSKIERRGKEKYGFHGN